MQPMQSIIHWQDGAESLIVLKDYFSHYCSALHPEKILDEDGITLRQNSITVFGKRHLEPRLTAWMGPRYHYSDIQWPENELSPLIQQMIQELQKPCPFPFNAVLLNYYRNGQDSMGKHRDNEPEIDSSLIASVSFGASRLIRFTSTQLKQKIDVVLNHGDLLIMHHMQERWYHELPKRGGVPHARLNLTFRRII